MRRVAIIGGGIAGLATAWRLAETARDLQVVLFEAEPRLGGHAHTVDVTLPDRHGRPVTHGVDTGFLVFNHRTYPQLVRLFDQLAVPLAASDMSFSVQSGGLEWCGTDLAGVFAQRRNLLRPAFLGMLADLLRFNRLCTALARAEAAGEGPALSLSVGEFLDRHRFGPAFREDYLLPMVGCIWSCSTAQMLRFPIATLIRFCHNHGLLQLRDRPQWYTVAGGSREYVRRLRQHLGEVRLGCPVRSVRPEPGASPRLRVVTDPLSEVFDAVVFACHSDQALGLLGDAARPRVRQLLGAIAYQPNRAVLHTDTRLLPQRPRAWAAWNYERAGAAGPAHDGVCLHYLISRLQPLPFAAPVIVSLNPVREPDPALVLAEHAYAHPVFDAAAIAAQADLPGIQGRDGLWFCGAWTGYGFHEDGLRAGLAVADALRAVRSGAPARDRAAPPAGAILQAA